jgi:hypothetical protein
MTGQAGGRGRPMNGAMKKGELRDKPLQLVLVMLVVVIAAWVVLVLTEPPPCPANATIRQLIATQCR